VSGEQVIIRPAHLDGDLSAGRGDTQLNPSRYQLQKRLDIRFVRQQKSFKDKSSSYP
jgi:hypothetical protein